VLPRDRKNGNGQFCQWQKPEFGVRRDDCRKQQAPCSCCPFRTCFAASSKAPDRVPGSRGFSQLFIFRVLVAAMERQRNPAYLFLFGASTVGGHGVVSGTDAGSGLNCASLRVWISVTEVSRNQVCSVVALRSNPVFPCKSLTSERIEAASLSSPAGAHADRRDLRFLLIDLKSYQEGPRLRC